MNDKQSNERVVAIIYSLQNAKNGKEVYKALEYLPTDNLNEMYLMCEHILSDRGWDKLLVNLEKN